MAARIRRCAWRCLSTVCNCPDRVRAVETLDKAGIAWEEAFVGGGGAALNIAVSAGFAISALAHCVVPPGLVEVGSKLGLPPLEPSEVVLHSHTLAQRAREALQHVDDRISQIQFGRGLGADCSPRS